MKSIDVMAVIERAIHRGLEDVAEMVLDESNERAPKETGELIASGYTSTSGMRAKVAYRAEHAVYQHERLDYRHDDGQAKFLEGAVDANLARAQQIMAEQAGKI